LALLGRRDVEHRRLDLRVAGLVLARRLAEGERIATAVEERREVVGVEVRIFGFERTQRAREALGRERGLCGGECYRPGDARRSIAAIEVVRIRPQRDAAEDPGLLVEDPWRRFECAPDPGGCRIEFEDPEYAASGRDAVYYARALEAEAPAINGANLRTEFDAAGNALRTRPCYADWRSSDADDCLALVQERAWSSPIFVDQPRSGGGSRSALEGELRPRAQDMLADPALPRVDPVCAEG
jgi:hypothetical protein